jgi:hypothetical protein
MAKEILNWTSHEVYTTLPRSNLPPDTVIHRANWTFSVKYEIANSIQALLLKGRAYIIGHTEKGELEVYDSVVSTDAPKLFLGVYTAGDFEIDQTDVSAAYLNSSIERDVYFYADVNTKQRSPATYGPFSNFIMGGE